MEKSALSQSSETKKWPQIVAALIGNNNFYCKPRQYISICISGFCFLCNIRIYLGLIAFLYFSFDISFKIFPTIFGKTFDLYKVFYCRIVQINSIDNYLARKKFSFALFP